MIGRIVVAVLVFWSAAAGAQSKLDVTQRDWTPMESAMRGQFIRATQIEAGLGVDPAILTIQEQNLSWSAGTRLVRVLGGWDPASLVLYFLRLEDGALIHLDGSYRAIEALNQRVRPALTEQTVADYIWFNGFFVRSKNGPFLVVESPQDRFIPALVEGSGKFAAGESRLEDIPRTLTCSGVGSNKGFRCAGTVYHATAIYAADFTVTEDGQVDIPSSRPLVAGLGDRVNAPIDPRKLADFRPYR